MPIKKLSHKPFWDRVGKEARDMIKSIIFDKGKNVYGGKWLDGKYSPVYGMKKSANKFKRQSGGYANKISPVLTGDLKNDTKPFATANSFGVRFAAHGGKVVGLNRMKRELSAENQPFPKKILKTIEQDVGKEISKQFKNKTTKITLGK